MNIDKMQNLKEYIILDIETTGLSARNDKIIEISAKKIIDNKVSLEFDTMVNPETPIPPFITKLTGITNNMVCTYPTIENIIPKLYNFFDTYPLIAHNAQFDMSFINTNMNKLGYNLNNDIIDTLKISRILYPHFKTHKLDYLAKMLNVNVECSHRAMADVDTLYEIFKIMQNTI